MAAVARAAYSCYVSWGAYNVGLLSFDHSLFDGSDVFGVSPLDASFGGAYDDVSDIHAGSTISRGRSNNLDTVLAGTANIDLRDPYGDFNPDNPGTVRNLVTNPSFELGTDGWSNGTATIARSIAQAKFGTGSGLFTSPGSGTNEYVSYITSVLTSGLPYTVSVYVKAPAGARMYLNLDVSPHTAPITTFVGTGDWQRVTMTATPNTTAIGTVFIATSTAGPAQAIVAYIDGGQVEQAAAATDYCDGDQPHCRWTGTAHASTSIFGGPLYGQLEDRLHPVKLTATLGGVTYGKFYGWVRRFHWEPQGRKGVTRLECVDLFYWLERANPVIASTGATTTGAAIGKILDAIGATDIGMRDLDVGDTIPDFTADGTQTGLQLIQGLLEAERGVFFIAGTGKATYRSRLSRLTKTSSATFADKFANAAPGVDWDQAYDRITVERVDAAGTLIHRAIAVDSAVVAKVGYNDMPAIQTTYMSSDAQTDNLAAWILSQNVSPKPPMRDFTIDNRESALLTQILIRELVDRVTVTAGRGGINGDFHIDSLSETIDGKTGRHTATWLLSKASTVSPALFDSASFDAGYQFVYGG